MSSPEVVDRPTRYFAFHFRMLRFLGLGWWHQPDENKLNNFPTWYIPYSFITQLVWVVGFVGLETIDPFIGNKEMERFMFSLSFVITHDLTCIKLYLFFFKNKELQEVVRILEIELREFYQNNVKNSSIVRSTRIMTSSFLFFGWATIANSNINGAIQDYRWKSIIAKLDAANSSEARPERQLAQPIYIPWGYQDDNSYIATFILEAAGLLWTGHIVMIIDTLIGSIIMHMSGQFEILQEAFSSVYDRTMGEMKARVDGNVPTVLSFKTESFEGEVMSDEAFVQATYTKDQIEEALECNLRSCIRQQQLLIKCVEKFSETYSYGFLTQLLSSMAAICVIMVQVSKDASTFKSISFATSLAFFFAMIIQLAIQCFTGNELTRQAQAVTDAVWNSKWERTHPRFRRQLVLVTARAQRPLRLSAAGFANMDNRCFLSIVKAAYSYYAVLSQSQI